MNFLGLSAYYHDSDAAVIINGEINATAQEERFTRKKHDAGFPGNAISYCLNEADISLTDIDHEVFYDKPLVKFERLRWPAQTSRLVGKAGKYLCNVEDVDGDGLDYLMCNVYIQPVL